MWREILQQGKDVMQQAWRLRDRGGRPGNSPPLLCPAKRHTPTLPQVWLEMMPERHASGDLGKRGWT
ncbi:MAG: hypothetical protein U1A77_22665 [Pirellulales bacterium]